MGGKAPLPASLVMEAFAPPRGKPPSPDPLPPFGFADGRRGKKMRRGMRKVP
ncbi:MAG: hypothetical protein ACOYLB_08450 [Phototrophicaceae bacterium]